MGVKLALCLGFAHCTLLSFVGCEVLKLYFSSGKTGLDLETSAEQWNSKLSAGPFFTMCFCMAFTALLYMSGGRNVPTEPCPLVGHSSPMKTHCWHSPLKQFEIHQMLAISDHKTQPPRPFRNPSSSRAPP